MRTSNLLISLILLSAPACAADPSGGAFTIFLSGKPFASETYSLEKSAGKIELNGSGKADLGSLKVTIEKFNVVTDDKFQPISAQADALMGKMKMQDTVTFADGKARNQMNSGQGPQAKEDDVHADALVVNANLPLFAWSPLAMRVKLDTTEPQTFYAYILGQTEVPVTVTNKGKEPVEFGGGKTIALNHFAMSFTPSTTASPLAVDIWLDDARRIIKIEVPAQKIEAYQQGYERKPTPVLPAEPAAPPKVP